jgi:transcriptional regulator with XRE-family HTH domain
VPSPENEEERIDTEQPFADWLRPEMEKQGISIQELANRTGLSYPGVWNIVRGNTKFPQQASLADSPASASGARPSIRLRPRLVSGLRRPIR